MCGIAGIVHYDPSSTVDRELLACMTSAVRHRGPDAVGFYTSEGVGFGHQRLAIIDPESGQQPMRDSDSRNTIVYNGEVYNYVELREELEAVGYRFTTDSDTEVVLKAYDHWSEECLQRLNGMWAFALWDVRRARLFLARDRLGIKPLHYFDDGSKFLFASEIKSLFAAGVPREPNLELLDVYLALGYVPAPYSFFHGIKKLKPGHYMLFDRRRTEIRKYWDLPRHSEAEMRTDQAVVREEFASLLQSSVRICMRSDVPFGAFLSGGLDSASVVTLMAEETPLPVETFTIGFSGARSDERALARLVATQVRSKHHEHVVEPEDVNDAVNHICFHHDEPFGDSSAIPTSHVASLARQSVKMVLTGDGGDEVLSGYTAYLVEKFGNSYARVPALIRAATESTLGRLTAITRGETRYRFARYERMLRTATIPFADRLLSKAAWLDRERRAALLGGIPVVPVDQVLSELMKDCPWQDPFYRLMYFNCKISLPDDMLTKVDRMTMAWSLEARVPFLDYRVVELMAQVHKNVKVSWTKQKTVLRSTVGRRLPTPLLKAPKRGFAVPLSAWFRSSDRMAPLRTDVLAAWGISEVAVGRIVDEQRSGSRDFGNVVWMLMVLQKVLAT